MNIDFPLILTLLTLGTGLVWLVDILFLRRGRLAKVAAEGESPATDEEETDEPYLIELCRSFFPILLIVLILRSFLVEPFQIPSGSMLPTLQVGDFILVNKFAYGVRLPVLRTKILSVGEPKRGDIMVFKYPVDGKTNFIKRVIGVPGDHIRYHNETLYINGKAVPKEYIADLPPYRLFEEHLGKVNHKMYHIPGASDPRADGEWVVPPHEYFMMGDNRDNSDDSRFWGFVPEHLIVGKAFAIWMHMKGWELPSFSRDRLLN